jgi:hypothetical protein
VLVSYARQVGAPQFCNHPISEEPTRVASFF